MYAATPGRSGPSSARDVIRSARSHGCEQARRGAPLCLAMAADGCSADRLQRGVDGDDPGAVLLVHPLLEPIVDDDLDLDGARMRVR